MIYYNSSDPRAMNSQGTIKHTGWSPTHNHDDRQLLDQLQACSHSLSSFSQRINEKNVIIYNLQENFNRERENFNRERSAMSHQVSTLQKELAIEKQKVQTANVVIERMNVVARKSRNGEEVEEVRQRDEAAFPTSQIGLEEAEQQRYRSTSLETERCQVQHQVLEPDSQKGQPQVLVQRDLERAASQGPTAVGRKSWQSAREAVSLSIENAPQHEPQPDQRQGQSGQQSQGQEQGQSPRKRRRAVRGGDRS